MTIGRALKQKWINWTIAALGVMTCLSNAWGETPSWSVQPKVCIVENLGDLCEMELSLSFHGLEPGKYCYFQDQTRLNCWSGSAQQTTLLIRFTKDTVLYLKSAQGNVILSHKMDIKARASNKQVRRVRQPWSLF
ncbi:DUF3019 domain-containing protein [Aliiglaciecola lipolytica]|uniref:DUF3019 domain-containing protein n=1 Tax=Aliiglaciecola lipolytica E3 TaxID=1127673 RepID=K6YVY3_9ALTE|nr:DUF3019 domain-containing protein [Aliiglaciecola lipolytica]GAC15410.1 hypothetical protein GLIP_2789 [Aliiglaciecola lipolytica E3]